MVESQVGLFLVGPRPEGGSSAAASAKRPETAAAPPEGVASPERVASPQRVAAPDGEPSPDRILRLSQGFLASAIMRTGLQLGVFDRLADGAAGAEAIAAAIEADARGARVLLDALAAAGLVLAADGTYSLSPAAERYLVSGRPGFVGGMVSVYADDVLWEAMRRLPEAVRHGGTALEDHVAQARHPYWEQLASALAESGDPAADAVADVLAPVLEGGAPKHVLDIACGNGAMACALARRDAAPEVWLLDWPDVVAVARRYAELLGLGERVHVITGDMMEVPLGGPYELILLSQVLHNLDAEACRVLLRRAADALGPGGVLAVHDMVRAAPPRDDPAPYLFSVITLAWTPGGDVRSLEEHETLLRAAGLALRDVRHVPHAGTRLLIAERPASAQRADPG
jgi:C-methyltransferase